MKNKSILPHLFGGIASLTGLDANYDGKLTAADQVWEEFRVWQDANGDGLQEAGETHTLAEIGITELDYAMSTFEQNGQIKQLASPDLEADTEGTRINVIPEGILVQNSADGNLSLLVTRIDDETAVEGNRDGVEAANESMYFCERIAA
ncbi:MAG: hypothetical protein PHG47_10320 [Sulfuricella sp.]|nr:hypothetical protein [Sulfuricella sp.]